ncbi:MAG: histidinol-phosphatase HisJ family protein [Oscillospiraceae bacterium]|nr:histidinol-phosphatase HisJ family protein [Oscillospiraceae bacterium]
MYLADMHMHTHISPDSEGVLEDYCAAAIEKGIKELYITDHCDVNGWEGAPYDFLRDAAFDELLAARDRYGDRIKINFGVELGQEQQNRELARETLEDGRLDFVIGSLHNLAGGPDFFFMSDMEADRESLWSRYFTELALHAEKSDFDVLGHITYPKRYIPVRWRAEYDDRISEILDIIISRGKGIEINTSGLGLAMSETLPPYEVVRRYRLMGGRIITVGSDCHVREKVGFRIADGFELAKSAGFDSICLFHKRTPEFVRI